MVGVIIGTIPVFVTVFVFRLLPIGATISHGSVCSLGQYLVLSKFK